MKLSELRQIIKEEIDKIKNPKTGKMIKVSSGLQYPKDSDVYKAAAKASIQGRHKSINKIDTNTKKIVNKTK